MYLQINSILNKNNNKNHVPCSTMYRLFNSSTIFFWFASLAISRFSVSLHISLSLALFLFSQFIFIYFCPFLHIHFVLDNCPSHPKLHIYSIHTIRTLIHTDTSINRIHKNVAFSYNYSHRYIE